MGHFTTKEVVLLYLYGVLTGFLLTVACLGIAIQYNSGILFLFGFLVSLLSHACLRISFALAF